LEGSERERERNERERESHCFVGCENDKTLDYKCSHGRAPDLFAESITHPNRFIAR